MKKNILNLYEGFFDDLDKLNKNQNDEFGDVNRGIYDEHDIILSPDKNPEFFYGLCDMCEYYQIPYNKNGFLQEDLDKITFIKSDNDWISFFQDIISLDELQYFHNLKKIYFNSFGNCFKLKSVIFPEISNKFNISRNSFTKCFSLEKIVIPKIFESMIYNIFYYVNLTNVNITYI